MHLPGHLSAKVGGGGAWGWGGGVVANVTVKGN